MIPKLLVTSRAVTRWTLSRRLLQSSSLCHGAAATVVAAHHIVPPPLGQLHVSANGATMEVEWSQEFAAMASSSSMNPTLAPKATAVTPEKKQQTSPKLQVSATGATMESEWAQQIAVADAPNAEDVAQLQAAVLNHDNIHHTSTEEMDRLLMQQLLVSSPESALGVSHVAETMNEHTKKELQTMFAQQDMEMPRNVLSNDNSSSSTLFSSHAMDLLLQHMLMACPESATGFSHVAETLTEKLKTELKAACTPLPTTLEEALKEDETRAIVITTAEAPFRVVHVNHAWEGLCGYSQQEAQSQPIGQLLQGPETKLERQFVKALLSHPSEPLATTIVNYTKMGRKFHNRLQVGPLFENSQDQQQQQQHVAEYLVGVLQEVDEQGLRIRQSV